MVTRRITLTIGICLAAFGLLVGCTRNRATPEPVATAAEAQISVITSTGGLDPIVTVVPANVNTTAITTIQTLPAGTLVPTTIDYYVVDGDTLSIVAEKFQVETETIRQLNYLLTDDIFVGQILRMPFREGITAEGAPTPTPEPYRYAVETGDSLGTIAQQFGVSAVAIMEANELQDPNSVYIGQVLEIPGYASPSSSAATTSEETTASAGEATSSTEGTQGSEQGVSHIVQPGETLTGIAQKYGVDGNAIAEANNVTNRNQLRIGQKLTIPGITERAAAEARGNIHIVQSGESLSAIAQLYGVTGAEIISFNNISNPDAIYVGQELIIPGP